MIKERFRGLDNASALMRFKSRNGIVRSKHVTTCGYLAMIRLKKAINKEFTDEHFKQLMSESNYSKTTRAGKDKRTRLIMLLEKVNRLPYPTIEALDKIYQTDGFTAFLRELN
jgi:hypothetical protein